MEKHRDLNVDLDEGGEAFEIAGSDENIRESENMNVERLIKTNQI